MRARGEQSVGDMQVNGEAHFMKCVVENNSGGESLIVLDVGANKGDWTKMFLDAIALRGETATRIALHAFEPVPSTACIFRDRVAEMPGHEVVELHQVAMSDASGFAEIGVFADGAGTNSLHFASDERVPQEEIEVELSSLDEFCEKTSMNHIHMVKCDAEGHDAKVLRGACGLLKQESIDVLQFEYNHRWVFGHAFLKDIFELVEGLPYTIVRLDGAGVTAFDTWHPELERFFQSNYALVHDRAMGWFSVHKGHFDNSNTYA